jgi:hypothetical protein
VANHSNGVVMLAREPERVVQKSATLIAARSRAGQCETEHGCESGLVTSGDVLTEQPLPPTADFDPPIDPPTACRLARDLEESAPPVATAWGFPFEVELRAARIRESLASGAWQQRDLFLARINTITESGVPFFSKTTWLDQPSPVWPDGFIESFDRAAVETRLAPVDPPELDRVEFVLEAGVHAAITRMVVAAVMKGIVKPGRLASELVGITDALPLGASAGWRDRRGEVIGEVALVQDGQWQAAPSAWPWPVDSWREAARPGARQLRWTGSDPTAPFPANTWIVTRAVYLKTAALVFGVRVENGVPIGRFGPVPVEQPWLWWFRVAAVLTPAVRDASDLPVVVPTVWLDR